MRGPFRTCQCSNRECQQETGVTQTSSETLVADKMVVLTLLSSYFHKRIVSLPSATLFLKSKNLGGSQKMCPPKVQVTFWSTFLVSVILDFLVHSASAHFWITALGCTSPDPWWLWGSYVWGKDKAQIPRLDCPYGFEQGSLMGMGGSQDWGTFFPCLSGISPGLWSPPTYQRCACELCIEIVPV